MSNDQKKPPHRVGKAKGVQPGAGNKRKKAEAPDSPDRDTDRERIAKRISRSGVASRREAEAMIAGGRVKVNGNVLTSPAFNVGARDVVLVDGQRLPERERTRLFLFHKPSETMTTNRDPEGRKTIFDVLPDGLPRLMTVGRLDFTTEGLLLMTNDGGLARVLELPSTGWLRRYRARVHGDVDEAALDQLKEGIAVEGVLYGAIDATLERKQGSNAWLSVALREGKNREIKKVLGALGLNVTRLIRVSYGPFQLGSLEPGSIMELKGRMLRDQLGDRLIAEAGADFDAQIIKPFSNKPANKDKDRAAAKKSVPHDGRRESSFREEGLKRLQTRHPDEKSRTGKRGQNASVSRGDDKQTEGDKRKFEPPRSRASNVWMAPGARPQGKKPKSGFGDEKSGKSAVRANPSAKSGRGKVGQSGRRNKNADRRR